MALTAIEIIKSIGSATVAVYNQVQLAKANKAQCKRLNERVAIVAAAVKGLEELNNVERFAPALKKIHEHIIDSHNFIKQFSDEKSWWKNLLKAGNHKSRFEKLSEQLQDAIIPLNLGINAQEAFNREQDIIDQKADFEYIMEQQEQILRLSEENNEHLQKIKLEQNIMKLKQDIQNQVTRDQNQALLERIASLRSKFNQAKDSPRKHQQLMDSQFINTAEELYQSGVEFYQAKEYKKSFIAYQKAEALGHIKATTGLGYMYLKGRGVQKDKKTAYEKFLISANNGHARAMFNLARMFECGVGVNKDEQQALQWYNDAAALGDKNAIKKSKELALKFDHLKHDPSHQFPQFNLLKVKEQVLDKLTHLSKNVPGNPKTSNSVVAELIKEGVTQFNTKMEKKKVLL